MESRRPNGVTLGLRTSASGILTPGSLTFVVQISDGSVLTGQAASRTMTVPMYESGEVVSVRIDDLEPGSYQFQATAENMFGTSQPSVQTGSVNISGK